MKKIIITLITIFMINQISAREEPTTATYTFVLTHLGSIKLSQNAYFKAGDTKTWTLDLGKGNKIYYLITGRVGNNPMCGLTAKDNLGDICAICITKLSGDNVEIELRYSSRTFTYKGYILR